MLAEERGRRGICSALNNAAAKKVAGHCRRHGLGGTSSAARQLVDSDLYSTPVGAVHLHREVTPCTRPGTQWRGLRCSSQSSPYWRALWCSRHPLPPTPADALSLTGEAEVPGPGDSEGSGSATVDITTNGGEICVDLTWEISDGVAAAAHIHEGPAGEAPADNVVLALFTESTTPAHSKIASTTPR